MTLGSSLEQLSATSQIAEADLAYYGICFFGDTEIAKELTKKFSLFQ